MFKTLIATIAMMMTATAFAHHTPQHTLVNKMETALGRELTQDEKQNVGEMVAELTQGEVFAQAEVSVNVTDAAPRNISYNLGCLTAKVGAWKASTQKLVCTNLMEVFTISKSSGFSEDGQFTLNFNGGVTYARLSVNLESERRLNKYEILNEPVNAIGIEGAWGLLGGQAVYYSSTNVTLWMLGVNPGYGGTVIHEQNGDVDRASYDGSALKINKFNF